MWKFYFRVLCFLLLLASFSARGCSGSKLFEIPQPSDSVWRKWKQLQACNNGCVTDACTLGCRIFPQAITSNSCANLCKISTVSFQRESLPRKMSSGAVRRLVARKRTSVSSDSGKTPSGTPLFANERALEFEAQSLWQGNSVSHEQDECVLTCIHQKEKFVARMYNEVGQTIRLGVDTKYSEARKLRLFIPGRFMNLTRLVNDLVDGSDYFGKDEPMTSLTVKPFIQKKLSTSNRWEIAKKLNYLPSWKEYHYDGVPENTFPALIDVEPYTTYNFRLVMPLNDETVIFSNYTQPYTTIASGLPENEPTVSHITPGYSTMYVQWEKPSRVNGPVIGYNLILTPYSKKETLSHKFFPVDQQRDAHGVHSFEFTGLKPEHKYKLEVSVWNNNGSGPPAIAKEIITKPRPTNPRDSYIWVLYENFVMKRKLKDLLEPEDVYVVPENVKNPDLVNKGPTNLTAFALFKKTNELYLSDGYSVWKMNAKPTKNTPTKVLNQLDLNIPSENSRFLNIKVIEIDWINNYLYIGVGNNAYRFDLNRKTSQNLIQHTSAVTNMQVDPINGWLYTSTGNGTWKHDISSFENSITPKLVNSTPYLDSDLVSIDSSVCAVAYWDYEQQKLVTTSCQRNAANHTYDVKLLDETKRIAFFDSVFVPTDFNSTFSVYEVDEKQHMGKFSSVIRKTSDGRLPTITDMFANSRVYQPDPEATLAVRNVKAILTLNDILVFWEPPELKSFQTSSAFKNWRYKVFISCVNCQRKQEFFAESNTTRWRANNHSSLQAGKLYNIEVLAGYGKKFASNEVKVSIQAMSLFSETQLPEISLVSNDVSTLTNFSSKPSLLLEHSLKNISADIKSNKFPDQVSGVLHFRNHSLYTTKSNKIYFSSRNSSLEKLNHTTTKERVDIALPSYDFLEIMYQKGYLYWMAERRIFMSPLNYVVKSRTDQIRRLQWGVYNKIYVENDLLIYSSDSALKMKNWTMDNDFEFETTVDRMNFTVEQQLLGFSVDRFWPTGLSASNSVEKVELRKVLVWMTRQAREVSVHFIAIEDLLKKDLKKKLSFKAFSDDELPEGFFGAKFAKFDSVGGRFYYRPQSKYKLCYIDMASRLVLNVRLSETCLFTGENIHAYKVADSGTTVPDITSLLQQKLPEAELIHIDKEGIIATDYRQPKGRSYANDAISITVPIFFVAIILTLVFCFSCTRSANKSK